MAVIRIQTENRVLSETEQVRAFLAPHGIQYDNWEVAGRIGAQASADEILEAYAPEIEQLKIRGGYITEWHIPHSP
jgi:1,2-dihydroxy-3-keto-5-methylthiopentene dioxygenase